MNLNENQIKAVHKVEGPLRIVAGPGSGKTRTLVSKISYLVQEGFAKPEEILAISFTNKAANEIKDRVYKEGTRGVTNIYTYHGWCNYFLRVEADALGLGSDFTIIDSSDSTRRITNLIKANDLALEKNDVLSAFEKISREDLKVSDLLNSAQSAHVQIAVLWEKYTNDKRINGQLDFNDLISEVKKLVTENEYIREKWKAKYKYIFIDEFQDTNNIQFDIIRAITNPDSNITVVGDPDQNIYSWRGANISLINNFSEWYPTAETIMLDVNYRSTPFIIHAANSLIKNNKDRVAEFSSVASKEGGTPLQILDCENEAGEAWSIARKIKALQSSSFDLHDIAIIVRLTYKTRLLENAFNNEGIPYRVIGAMRFFDRAEVKQTIKFLLFAAKQDNSSLLDIINDPPKKFGPKKVQMTRFKAEEENKTIWNYLVDNIDSQSAEIQDWIKATQRMINDVHRGDDVGLVLYDYLTNIGYIGRLFEEENRVENIKETISIIRNALNNNVDDDLDERIVKFYNDSILSSSADKSTENGEVNIITAHASKGTEFPFVFLYSFNEGHWPSARAIESGELEEERRVAYVAATRAMEQLYITTAEGIDYYTNKLITPSRFLGEMQEVNIYSKSANTSNKIIFEPADEAVVKDGMVEGDMIFHTSFGEGVVIDIDDSFITVKFKDGTIQEILRGHRSYKKL